MFISEVLPAPDGPIIAVRCPDLKAPLTLFKICLISSPNKETIFSKMLTSVKYKNYIEYGRKCS